MNDKKHRVNVIQFAQLRFIINNNNKKHFVQRIYNLKIFIYNKSLMNTNFILRKNVYLVIDNYDTPHSVIFVHPFLRVLKNLL